MVLAPIAQSNGVKKRRTLSVIERQTSVKMLEPQRAKGFWARVGQRPGEKARFMGPFKYNLYADRGWKSGGFIWSGTG